VTPAQCRAARGMTLMTQWQLAQAADVPRGIIIDFELNALPPKPAYLEAMLRVLEQAGVEFTDGEPPGVRFREREK
jgi:predicted transcriptional regulator